MRKDLADELSAPERRVSLNVGRDRWNLYVFGLNRVHDETFIQIALLGPRVCTVTVRTRAEATAGVKARQVLAAVRGWLASNDASNHAYLDVEMAVESDSVGCQTPAAC